eukprot:Gregarina_sp_Poly_1__2589@NODE_1702_length_3512_cov_284_243251_g1115_i0_p2_GENE_NODE_1702_length_3512_cov_284_243251_g1115_i0NODE_1702_length_3512_cov_284_243251_g1115_i0_p2_ORF_typecomplete_len133_score25_17_NODE_1702_length_3512_cov_284_243251_g1115_i016172015
MDLFSEASGRLTEGDTILLKISGRPALQSKCEQIPHKVTFHNAAKNLWEHRFMLDENPSPDEDFPYKKDEDCFVEVCLSDETSDLELISEHQVVRFSHYSLKPMITVNRILNVFEFYWDTETNLKKRETDEC